MYALIYVFSIPEDYSHRGEKQHFVPTLRSRLVSKRSISPLSPRFGMLNYIPFAIPFGARVNIFRSFIVNDKHNIGIDIRPFGQFHSHTRATVRPGHVAEDVFDKLREADLKHLTAITFINQFCEE